LLSCGDSDTSLGPSASPTTTPCPVASGTHLVRETLTGTISAATSPMCSEAFKRSVHPNYFLAGSQRCIEYRKQSLTPGMIVAELHWTDSRIDLDLALNDGVGANYRQSLGSNKCCERLEFFVNGCTEYVLVVPILGVDPFFLANGGTFTGEVSTAYTLTLERPE
jgi:hypothetical protein